MPRTIEKIIVGILLVAIFGISSFVIASLREDIPSESILQVQDLPLETVNSLSQAINDDTEEELSPEEISRSGKTITEEQAISIAKNAVSTSSAGKMTDVELEKEQGILVYAVEFTKNGIETDVKIDAKTGKIVKIESDLDEEDEED